MRKAYRRAAGRCGSSPDIHAARSRVGEGVEASRTGAAGRPIEDVGEYPRPPRLERAAQRARIWIGDELVADAGAVWRVLETFHPPTIYLPRDAFVEGVLQPAVDGRRSMCEWKGTASYLDLHATDGTSVIERAAWTYPDPSPAFAELADAVAVYPGRVTRCELDGEQVAAQPGDFYGGWLTSWITGPVKGAPGTTHW